MSDYTFLHDKLVECDVEGMSPREAADALLAAGVRPPARVIRTATELADLRSVPVGTVVRSDAGTIACRFDQNRGVLLGDDRVFRWADLGLPVRVLFDPAEVTS